MKRGESLYQFADRTDCSVKEVFMRYQKNMSHKEIMTELMLNTEATSRERLRYCQQNLRNNITKNADYLQLIAEYYPFILKSIKQK